MMGIKRWRSTDSIDAMDHDSKFGKILISAKLYGTLHTHITH